MVLLKSFRLFFLTIFYLFSFTTASSNITLDDTDSSIQYSAGWSVPPTTSNLNFGGTHHSTEYQQNGSVVFDFTGTAIYILSPLWPYRVGGLVSIDGSSSAGVDMQDYGTEAAGGEETVNSSIIWGVTGLANTSHSLRIWTDTARWDFLALDGIIYTVPGSEVPLVTLTSSNMPIPTTQASTSLPPPNNGSMIFIGVIVGIVGIGVLVVTSCMIRKRIKRARRRVDLESMQKSVVQPFLNSQPGPPSYYDSIYGGIPMEPGSAFKDNLQASTPVSSTVELPQPPISLYRLGPRGKVDVCDSRHDRSQVSLARVKTWSGTI
ncbi:hypothetical protein VNI00_012925 [Paramarasmius palmivorus]|uniref:Uncharacterized protein n=1 Tax=Paramarasmius palmivorus TaxID=297713 RepID=A0AAW0C1F8_9AGAR